MTTNPFTAGSSRTKLSASQVAAYNQSGALVLDTRRRRPLYFDGRFLAARDLQREQDYFLQRQADLGRTAGFGVVHGLMVELVTGAGSDSIRIHAGQGITPAGELVLLRNDLVLRLSDLAEEEKLDVQFGVARIPRPAARTRTGLYVIALRPVEFTANPITSYPTSIEGSRTTHDGDIVEATAVTLTAYPDPSSNYEPSQRRAAVAQQIFTTGSTGQVNDGLLPVAMVSLQRGSVEWIDPWMVRRETARDYAGARLGLTDNASKLAFFMQYDSQLREIMSARNQGGLSSGFGAATYFRAIPGAGRFPLASINTGDFSQTFFPQQLDVRLSIVPDDEIPALLDEGMNLPSIDLTQPPDSYQQIAVFALVPLARDSFNKIKSSLVDVPLKPVVPQVVSFRRPLELLTLYRGGVALQNTPPLIENIWKEPVGSQTFGYYIRRRSAPQFVDFTTSK